MADHWMSAVCPTRSESHIERARRRQSILTKPAGSLGRLEELVIELAGLQASDTPRASDAPIIIFAGDHGVTAQGVSAYPAAVTVEMLRNFTTGGAAISVLSSELGSSLEVVDAGTLAGSPLAGIITDKPRRGTHDFSVEPAMTADELDHALGCGRRALDRVAASSPDLIIYGEMGIGNTTAAAAIASALLGRTPADLVGDGTGVGTSGRKLKAEVIGRAMMLHGLDRPGTSAMTVLTSVGGLEIAALTGAIVAAAQRRLPVLVDGFIVSVAALAAVRLNPSCRPWLLYSHRSAERGHAIVLEALAARPVLDLDLRLGEASGSALALPILRLACALHNRMATFAEADVSQRPESGG